MRRSRRHEKHTLQYDPVFAASAETSNSRRAAPSASLRGWAGFINLPHKEVSLFRKYCQYWLLLVHTKRKRRRRKEDSYVILLDVDITKDDALSMTQRRVGYKKYCDALEKRILRNFSSIVTCEKRRREILASPPMFQSEWVRAWRK